MAIKLIPPPIIPISGGDGNRCIVVYDYATIDTNWLGENIVLEHGPQCVFTEDGYKLPRRCGCGPCVEERLHPYPPFHGGLQ